MVHSSQVAAVQVLVEHIKDPGLSFDQLAQHVRPFGHLGVEARSIAELFEKHGLKKTADTSSVDP